MVFVRFGRSKKTKHRRSHHGYVMCLMGVRGVLPWNIVELLPYVKLAKVMFSK